MCPASVKCALTTPGRVWMQERDNRSLLIAIVFLSGDYLRKVLFLINHLAFMFLITNRAYDHFLKCLLKVISLGVPILGSIR